MSQTKTIVKEAGIANRKRMKNILIHSFFILVSVFYVLPFLYVISISLSNEKDVADFGYKLVPMNFDLTAYTYVFANAKVLINGYLVTAFQTLAGTVLSILLMAMAAYPLSRTIFKLRSAVILFILLAMFFGPGPGTSFGSVPTVPSYILVSRYLHLSDSIWAYIIPGLAVPLYIIMFVTFFKSISEAMIESAKIDGAGELNVFFRIIIPLSKPILATLSFMVLLARWNDFMTSLIYISNPNLVTLQFLLQKILWESEFLKSLAENSFHGIGIDVVSGSTAPLETMTFAMCIIAAGPMLVIFPFFQKYFSKGMMIGSVKG